MLRSLLRTWRQCLGAAVLLSWLMPGSDVRACCAVAGDNRAVVNADQTVIMIWDAAQKTQHFIRQASFKSDAADVGFLVPVPSRPQLEEAGDQAFARLDRITRPAVQDKGFSVPLGCSVQEPTVRNSVRVIEQKRVAGFDAAVLTAANGSDLNHWLREHGYSYSKAVEQWAHPYVAGGWMMVALKIPKAGPSDLHAGALRLSFQTDQPVFPYREPASADAAKRLGTNDRLLRIYFIGDGRYQALLGRDKPWNGRVVWSGDISSHRATLLRELKLPAATGPANWWLTEFSDNWPYAPAPGDLWFSKNTSQKLVARPAVDAAFQGDLALTAFFAFAALRPLRGKSHAETQRRRG